MVHERCMGCVGVEVHDMCILFVYFGHWNARREEESKLQSGLVQRDIIFKLLIYIYKQDQNVLSQHV